MGAEERPSGRVRPRSAPHSRRGLAKDAFDASSEGYGPRMKPLRMLVVLLAGCPEPADAPCPTIRGNEAEVSFIAAPFSQVRREHVRLRWVTGGFDELPVAVEHPDERCPSLLVRDSERFEQSFFAPIGGEEVAFPDLAGEPVVHTTRLDGLTADGDSSWAIVAGVDESTWYSGHARAPAPLGQASRVALVGSLAPPTQSEVLSLVPDVDAVFLLGDLRRNGVAASTWSQLSHDVHQAQPGALVHAAIGDLEDADVVSRDEMFLRWFGGQGRPGSTDRYFAIDISGVRFVVLDAEDPRLGIEGSVQWKWLEAELQDVADTDALREVIVLSHRGPHGLSEQLPEPELRESLLPFLTEAGVRLWISGQGHGYQRFQIDDLILVDAGTGGGALTSLDHRLERDEDGVAARQVAISGFGVVELAIAEDGAVALTFHTGEGEVGEIVKLDPPG